MKKHIKIVIFIFFCFLIFIVIGCDKESEENNNPTTVEEYNVSFIDYDGVVLSNQLIIKGNAATAPTVTAREGYEFIGWDKDFNNVSSDLVITAQYQIKEFSLFVNSSNSQILITDEDNNDYTNESKIKYGTILSVEVISEENYIVEHLLINDVVTEYNGSKIRLTMTSPFAITLYSESIEYTSAISPPYQE